MSWISRWNERRNGKKQEKVVGENENGLPKVVGENGEGLEELDFEAVSDDVDRPENSTAPKKSEGSSETEEGEVSWGGVN
jgi:hypothetical protein